MSLTINIIFQDFKSDFSPYGNQLALDHLMSFLMNSDITTLQQINLLDAMDAVQVLQQNIKSQTDQSSTC